MVSLALGLMAKQMLVTLPFVLLLLDYWPLRRFSLAAAKSRARKAASGTISFARCFAEKLPLLALSAVASLVVLLVQSRVALIKRIPLSYRLGNAVVAYAEYIVKMFWPLRLGVLYPHPGVALPLWQVLVSGLFLLGISVLIVLFSRNRRWLVFGWVWYLGTLVPVIGLVQVGLQAMADRYTYVPLIGLFLIIAWGAPELSATRAYRNVLLGAGAAVVLSVLTALTSLQLSHWRNSVTLFSHTVAVTSNNDILHYNLGVILLEHNDIDGAVEHWSEALRIKPDQPTIHKNLAALLARQGRIDRAIEHYRQSLRYRPKDDAARRQLRSLLAGRDKLAAVEKLYNHGNVLAAQGKLDQAIVSYTKALQLNPDYAPAHNNLGNALFLRGKPREALAHYSTALKIDPNLADARYNRAAILAGQGRTDEAIEEYRKTLEIDPDYTKARHALEALLRQQPILKGPQTP